MLLSVGLALPCAQAQLRCTTALNPLEYEAVQMRVKAEKLESRRLDTIKTVLTQYCYNSEQIRDLVGLLSLGSNRLEVARMAWHRVTDGYNYPLVAALLPYESQKQQLNDYILAHPQASALPPDSLSGTKQPTDTLVTRVDTTVGVNVRIVVSAPFKNEEPGYYGPIGCTGIMSQAALSMGRTRIGNAGLPEDKKRVTREILQQYCLNTRQLIELLGALEFETDRLEMAKAAYPRVYDRNNYYRMVLLFGHENNATDLLTWLPAQHPDTLWTWPRPAPESAVQGPSGCPAPVSDDEMKDLLQHMQQLSFQETKERYVSYITANRCFTTQQVIQLVELFAFEEMRLTIAKFLYPHTHDQGNFFLINDTFDQEESIVQMNQFLAEQK